MTKKLENKTFRTGYVTAQMRVTADATKTRMLVPVQVRRTQSGLYGYGEYEVVTPWGVRYRVEDRRDSVTDDLVAEDGMPFDGKSIKSELIAMVGVARKRHDAIERKRSR